MKAVHMIAFILLIVGGLNWLLVGLLGYDLLSVLGFDMGNVVSKTVYILVGISALVEVLTHKKSCKECSVPASM